MAANLQVCPVCEWPLRSDRAWQTATLVDCPICGPFDVEFRIPFLLQSEQNRHLRPALCIAIRQANDAGRHVILTMENFEAMARSVVRSPATSLLLRLVRSLASDSRLGQWLDYPKHAERKRLLQARMGVETADELEFLFEAGVADGLITIGTRDGEIRAGTLKVFGPDQFDVRVTPKGWAAIETGGQGVPGNCFVAMSFSPELDPLYDEAIKPATDECRLNIVRIDREEHNDNINDRIMAAIRQCEVLIADFTHHRGGVYFEAGFGLGLNRAVVFTCRKDHFASGAGVHFDTRPFNHLLWTAGELDEFRRNLVARLQNTVPSLKEQTR